MKRLLLVRHAKSSWDDPDLADFDRPLNDRGNRDAPRMGKRLKEKNIHPDMVLTSPAVRALKTCQIITGILGFAEKKIKTDRSLYHASSEQILRTLQTLSDLPDREEVVMLFGHNPGLTDFVNELLNENIDNIPTCGVVSCKLRADRWKDLHWGSGSLEFFDFPKK